MLEIVLLIMGSRKINEVAKPRGVPGWPFIILFILMWFGGEIVGAILGAVLFDDAPAAGGGFNCGGYMLALVGAAIGGGIGFGIGVGVPKAIGNDPKDFYRARRGDMLDPDRSFDLPNDGPNNRFGFERDSKAPPPLRGDDGNRDETSFRPYRND